MSGKPYVVRWGIISTGGIAKAFTSVRAYSINLASFLICAQDILLDPKTCAQRNHFYSPALSCDPKQP